MRITAAKFAFSMNCFNILGLAVEATTSCSYDDKGISVLILLLIFPKVNIYTEFETDSTTVSRYLKLRKVVVQKNSSSFYV